MIVKLLPINLRLDPNDEVVKVAAGRSHSFFLTKKSKGKMNIVNIIAILSLVYSLGNNSFGQCGVPIIEGQIFSASHIVNRVELPEKVVEIVCGQDNTFFITEKGSLYSCGLSTDGQTGLGHFDCVGIPQKVGGDLSGENIMQVSCISDGAMAVSGMYEIGLQH